MFLSNIYIRSSIRLSVSQIYFVLKQFDMSKRQLSAHSDENPEFSHGNDTMDNHDNWSRNAFLLCSTEMG